jgi:hypothetical protein
LIAVGMIASGNDEPVAEKAVKPKASKISKAPKSPAHAGTAPKSNRPSVKTQPSKRSATKLDAIVTSLRQRKGATIAELMDRRP